MRTRNDLISACTPKLVERWGRKPPADIHKRFKRELLESEVYNEIDYFLDTADQFRVTRQIFPYNENNLLIPYLLGLCPDFSPEKPSHYVYGESPDIDVDFLPMVRDHVKIDWAPQEFGVDNVCNISSYGRFGIKSSLADMARVFDEDRTEVLDMTTKMGLKDEEGKTLTWEKAVELYPVLAEYCQKHPELTDSARRLINRNRGKGKHAGGLIISRSPIHNLVPIMIDSDGNPASAWTEGLHDTELQPVGLVKFDLLVIKDLLRIVYCCKLIKDRHPEVKSICARPGQSDWTDISYLGDEAALELAGQGRLKCIFQFDSPGIRQLVRKGGVDSFEDLVAYSALYRPGPLGMKMHERYIERKRGREEYSLHPVIEPILGKTYGVMVYQEQVMRILNAVGLIPLKDCEIVRKAISKKKEKIFKKYKEMFLENGQQVLGWSLDEVQNLWDQIASFAEYGFNKSHAVAYTYISSRLLWLKAHYPLEFFTATLQCEDDAKKIKEYKIETEEFKIKVNRLDLNCSKENFSIVGDEIYIGFGNVKGIGKAATGIVGKQPYSGFMDFIDRFGTDAGTMKALVGLKLFKDVESVDSAHLYEYIEKYKKTTKSHKESDKRNETTRMKIIADIQLNIPELAITHELITEWNGAEDTLPILLKAGFVNTGSETDEDKICLAKKLFKKYNTSFDKHQVKASARIPVILSEFSSTGEINDKLKAIYAKERGDIEVAYYGFAWNHPLEDYEEFDAGNNWAQFDDDNAGSRPVQIIIRDVKKSDFKNGAGYRYVVKGEDCNWRSIFITVWKEDYERFAEELQTNHLVRMSITRTDRGYNLFSWPRWEAARKRPKLKAQDGRVLSMTKKGA